MQTAKQLNVVPDITNNVLYIRAPQYMLDEIRKTLERVDVGEWKPTEQELFKLKNANANAIVATLKPIFQKMMADIAKTQLYIPEEVKASLEVDIFPDVQTNAVIIMGGEEGRAQARKLVQQYDVTPEWLTEIIQLKHAKADEVLQTVQMTLQRSIGAGAAAGMVPSVTAQTSTSLLISCGPAELREVMAVLEKIDMPNPEALQQHVIKLEFALPSDIAQTITQILSGTSAGLGGGAAPRVAQTNRPMRGQKAMPAQVRQLQMQQQQQQQQQQIVAMGGGAGGNGPLLLPDDDAKVLMVYCAEKDWPEIEKLAKDLDAQAATIKPLLHTIELKKANPEDVAAMVNSMFPAGTSAQPQIVTADVYNNTIQIFATPDFVEQVVPLIETLDINATSELTVIKLENCKADVIAPILAQAVPGATAITSPQANRPVPGQPGRPQPRPAVPGQPQIAHRGDTSVRIVAEPITNSLLITAPPKELEQIQKLVEQMEQYHRENHGIEREVIVALEHRPSDEIATTLTTLLGSGSPTPRAGMPAGQAVAGDLNPAGDQLKIVANGDRLILKGPERQIAKALLIIERIDVPDQTPEARQYAVNDAETDEQKLRSMLAGRVAAAAGRPNPMTNRGRPGTPVQGQNVQQITIPTGQPNAGIQIYADTYQNTLLITAMPKEFPEIEEMLKVILSDPPGTLITGDEKKPEQFFMVRLKYKTAWDIEFTLDDLVNTDDRSEVEFMEGPTEKDLIVRGHKPGQEEAIRNYITMFDVPGEGQGKGWKRLGDEDDALTRSQIEMKLKLLNNRSPNGLPIDFIPGATDERVQVIDIHEGEEPPAPAAPAVPESNGTITPTQSKEEPPSNEGTPVGLAPSSRREAARQQSRARKEAVGAPIASGSICRGTPASLPYWFMHAHASWAIAQASPTTQPSVNGNGTPLRFMGETTGSIPGSTPDRVSIIQDPATGQFIMVGPPDELEELERILIPDDEDSPTVIRLFPLKYSDVNDAAQKLSQVFNQQVAPQQPQPQQQGGRRQQNQQQGGQPQIDPRTGQPVAQPQPQPQAPQQPQGPQMGRGRGASAGALLKVVPDERTKSLFVIARLSDIPLIIEVLKMIDTPVVESKNMRIFRLTNLEAEQVVENLREVLGISTAAPAGRGRGRAGQPQQPQGDQQQGIEQQIVGLPGTQGGTTVAADKIKLTAEPQTNIIIAQAPLDTLEVIAGLIEALEKETNVRKWEMRSVKLEHARATDIADIVDDLARELLAGGGGGQPQAQPQGGPGGGRGRGRGANRVHVEADSRTNSVIVAGEKKDLDVCEQIIKDLDVDEGDNAVRQFTVKGTPSEIVPALKELFVGNRGGGGRGGSEDADVIITANDATRTILVKAPAPQMAEIEKQINEMDDKVESAQALRTIKLMVANAEVVATKMTEVFAQPGGGRGARGEVTIKGVKANNTLYVRSPDDMFESIKTIAQSMDAAPSDVGVTRFVLKNAVAQDVHQRVTQLMMPAMALGGSASTMNLDFVGITPDPRTNSLVLVGGPTSALLLKSLIDEIDVAPETPMVRSTAAYTLPAGQDVNQVMQNINQLFQGVSPQTTGVEAPKVTANVAANLIIVEANADQQKKIKEGIIDPILNNVDQKIDYVYQVKNAQATLLANTVMSQVRLVFSPIAGKYPVNITGDDGANTLLINSSEPDYKTVMAMIEPLDVEPKDRITRAFKVNYVAPWTLANIINQQYATTIRNPNERVTAAFEDGTMSIIVTANAKNMEQIAKLIEETDVQGKPKETRFIAVKQARADDLQRALDASLRGRMPVQRSGQYPFNITADPSSNTLVVTAESHLFPDIEELVKQLDVPTMGTADIERKTITLTYADPGAVGNNIRQSFAAIGRNPSPRDVVTVTENWTTNSVFVTASPENMTKIEALVTEMDGTQTGGARINRVIEVTNANPNDVAQAVQAIFQDVYRNRRQQTPPTVKAIPGTSKIIAFANEEEFKQIDDLIKKVDIEGGRTIHTIMMPEQVPARTVSETITRLVGTRGGAASDGPKAEYHEPTNTVLVSATDAEFENINKQVIEPLTKTTAIGTLNFYKIPLKFAVANEVAQTLQEFFDKKAGIARQGNLPPWMRSNTSEQRENQVTVMAETGSNTLLVYATETTKALIDDLIKDIDVDRTEGQSIEMIALQYVDAQEMLDVMTEVLKVQKRTSAEDREPIPWWMDARREEEEEEVVLAGGMRLKAIESSNSLIVSGKTESVADAVTKIKELDVPTGVDKPEVFVASNGNVTDMAETLKKVFVEGREPAGRGAAAAQKLTIVADETANKLIVRGKTSDVNAVLEMAKQMDEGIDSTDVGMQLVQVPPGQNVEVLARDVQDQINNAERNKAQRLTGYKADLVTITPNTRANVLMINASKANLEQVKRTVQDLVAMGPAGGQTTVLIPISEKLSPQQVQDLIRQMQEGQNGSGSSGNRGGRRGDATWTQHRRYERLIDESSVQGKSKRTRRATTVAATMPILMMQLAFSTAVAQSPPPKEPDANRPRIARIRPRETTTQPATTQNSSKADAASLSDTLRAAMQKQPERPLAQSAGSRPPIVNPRPTTTAPAERGMPVNRFIDATTKPSDFANWSPEAREALRLTGADVTVSEAGPGMLSVQGLESDVATIQQLIRLLEQSVPDKRVEYFRLKNASATDLATTLSQVFQRLEQSGAGQPLPQNKVDIIPDSRTNGLYVAASDDKMEQARTLITQADTAVDVGRISRAFVFKNRRVSESGEVLKKLIDAHLKQRGLAPSLISMEIDPHTNTAFVTAGESDLETVAGFVNLLDAPIPEDDDETPAAGGQGRADIMVVPLRVAKADTLATLLSGLLQKAATGDTPMKDFIRRLRLLDQNGIPLATIDLNKPIFVFGDPDSNSLMIASTIENCLIMKQVAMAFDVEPAKAEVVTRIYNLKYADAEELATRLNDVLTDSEQLTKRPGQGDPKGVPEGPAGALVYEAVVKADPRTNQVVIVGRPSAVDVFDNLIKNLDVPGSGVMPFEIVKLEFASPTALATALTEMLDKRKETIPGATENVTKNETVIITPDARSQTLIIAAKRERMEELKSLVKQLDVRASALVENIRTISLKNSNATELSEKLKDLWTQTREQREGGESTPLGLEIPAIVADERSNSLIVSASLSDFESIKGVVDKIENLELNPMANIYIVRLKYNSASQLSEALQSLFQARAEMRDVSGEVRPEDKVTIEVDETTNSLLVAASRENYEVLMDKVRELDVEVGVMGQVEFFPNENVSAFRVKEVIDTLFEEPPFRPGAAPEGEGAELRERVTTVVDDRSNTLIVTASPENMAIIREIHKRMNSLTSPWDMKDSRVVQLQNADAVQVAAQVEDYFDRLEEVNQGEEAAAARYSVRILADEKRNRVIIGGTRDGIQRALDLIEQLDVPAGEPNQLIKVYKINEAPAQKVGEMIKNIFQERNQPRGETGAQVPDIPVTIETNDAARTIVVNASRLDHALIEELIKQLDRPSALLDMVKVFPLERARAERIKEILDEVYQSAGADAEGGQAVAVVADERTNSVVIAAPPGELTNIQTIIGRLDNADIAGVVEVGVYPCENEDAEKMAEILTQIMMGEGGEGGGGAEKEFLPSAATKSMIFHGVDRAGQERVLQTLRENVQITFNARSNSVIVVAPPATQKIIKELIEKLDGIEKKEVLVKVFVLRHADATKTVEILEKMFAQEEGSGDQAEFQEGRELNVEGGGSASSGTPTAFSQEGEASRGTFGKPKTTFVPDERTNAIIAAGWPADIDVVADIIDQLDSREVPERESLVYTAVNMKAVDMQSALDSYFQAEKSVFDNVGDTVSPQQKMEREVSVIAHEESNQLMVSVSPRQKERVLALIEQIDAAPPQVMIQVMIAEVTLDDRFEMGLEFALQELRFSETAVAGGNGVLQSSHFDVVGGTDLGAAGSGLGGFSFTITGEDFNFLMRALQSDSRLEVIQRPMIMCQDNQIANISIGSRVPVLQGTTTGGATGGTVQSTVTYEEVGVILDVEPNINPDGWVYLKVAPEISDIAEGTIQIGPGVFAPIFTSRKADTFVAVKDGETVVIGGLITTTDSESESKVPLIGDIPGLGALFRTTTRIKRKTELLIALTPRIIRTTEDGYRMSIEARDQSGIITDTMKSSPLFEGIQLTPEQEFEIHSIEDMPAEADVIDPPAEGGPVEELDVKPTNYKPKPEPENKPKYGPQVPKYGPMVPDEVDDDVVARRTRDRMRSPAAAGP
ncbi:MAG TPA: secretin N-terminal domain-containing protein [Phycisphaerae bacterium]|nr:secretin N-terminal domain-containing protein [Phycisphaerae bacterium]